LQRKDEFGRMKDELDGKKRGSGHCRMDLNRGMGYSVGVGEILLAGD
jgi:uncharacterized protein YfiM (DUF2279 family)